MKWLTKVKLKLLAAIITVIISQVLGVYTKVMFVVHINDPFQRWFNIILYIFSWIMLFVAAYFVGKEALIIADQWFKKKMRETYDVTVDIPKKGIKHGVSATKKIHKETVKLHKKTVKHSKKHLNKTVNHSRKHIKNGVKAIKKVKQKIKEL